MTQVKLEIRLKLVSPKFCLCVGADGLEAADNAQLLADTTYKITDPLVYQKRLQIKDTAL